MIRKALFSIILSASFWYSSTATPDSVSIDTVSNYNGWGWDEILVVKNNYITLGIVPLIGGRVLQYDLGIDTFMIINESLLGDVFPGPSPTPWDGTWGYGGYKTWPAPQSVWNWPPPPILDWGAYEYEVFQYSNDSVCVWLKGQTETTRTPGLRFDRYLTVYRNSTCVKVTTVLFNENAQAQNWGVWDVTQAIVRHKPDNDYSNISVYFPITGQDDIWYSNDVPDREEILPGIEKVNYSPDEGKIFASVPEGWVCFVDERDYQVYAKVFDIVEGATYPDDGGIVQLYTSGSSPYMEIEVTGPVQTIGANGDSIIFTEYWYAAQNCGPVYKANHAGMVRSPLAYSRSSRLATGKYGVFNEGQLRIAYLNDADDLISMGPSLDVAPDVAVNMELTANPPDGTNSIELQAYDIDGSYIETIDRLDYSSGDSFIAHKASETPDIDGIADESYWDSAAWYPLDFVWLPYNDVITPDDFTGRFKISWNEEAILFLVEVTDDSLYDGHSNPLQNYWDDDCVEVFIDEDHSGGNHLYNFNAFAYHVSTTYDVVDNNTSGPALFNNDITAHWTKQGDIYTWELAMKIFDDSYIYGGNNTPVALTSNKELGFSLAYCDNDGSPSRENFIGSKFLEEAVSNNSYIDATIFGTLTLLGPDTPIDLIEPASSESENSFEVYPVPVKDILYYSLNTNNDIGSYITIRNVAGEKICTTYLKAGELKGELDVHQLEGGIYIVELKNRNDLFTIPIVIL